MKILVVEDDPDTREAITSFLAHSGYAVQAAENVMHALALMRDTPPDVLVTDFWLPGLSALELIAEVRLLGHRDLPVIVVSGHATDDDSERLMRAGAALLLTKPLELRQLQALIEFAR